MAKVFPFQPYRYAPEAGAPEDLLTQPYDKITPQMQARYLALSPNNLVRIELGERLPSDNGIENVYTRSARQLADWIASGVLKREEKPAFFPYFQEFLDPDTGERLVREGFIGLGAVEDYSAGSVYRHEQTLSGPKQDRLELLRHMRAHTGQLFMLYDDRYGEVDGILEQAARRTPIVQVRDEYDVVHTLWRIADPDAIGRIQSAMADEKLIIADGHHRYETALAFHRENPALQDACRVMMTFVNLRSPGLRILATHRLVNGLSIELNSLLTRARETFTVTEVSTLPPPQAGTVRIGLAAGDRLFLLETPREEGGLDVTVAHERILHSLLGLTEEDVREQRHVRYVRGFDAALGQARRGEAQLAILLQPSPPEEVARVAVAGNVMPQKSTDFYPKLLSGLTIYRLEK